MTITTLAEKILKQINGAEDTKMENIKDICRSVICEAAAKQKYGKRKVGAVVKNILSGKSSMKGKKSVLPFKYLNRVGATQSAATDSHILVVFNNDENVTYGAEYATEENGGRIYDAKKVFPTVFSYAITVKRADFVAAYRENKCDRAARSHMKMNPLGMMVGKTLLAFDPEYLKYAFDFFGGDSIVIRANDKVAPVVIENEDGEKMVISPFCIQDGKDSIFYFPVSSHYSPYTLAWVDDTAKNTAQLSTSVVDTSTLVEKKHYDNRRKCHHYKKSRFRAGMCRHGATS